MDFEINQISENEKWRDMIKEFDHDGDGRISFHEFIHAIEGFITKLYECDDKCAISEPKIGSKSSIGAKNISHATTTTRASTMRN